LIDKEKYEDVLREERAARKRAELRLEEKNKELAAAKQQLKQFGEAMAQQENLSVLFDKHPFPILVYQSTDYKILAINDIAIEKYGYSKAEFLSKNILDLHPESELKQVKKHLKAVNKGLNEEVEWTHVDAHSNEFHVVARGNDVIFNATEARMVVIEDVTEKRMLELEKEKQKQQYQDLIESSSDIIYRIDENGHFSYVNPAGVKLTGYSQKKLLKMNFIELIAPNYKKRVNSFYRFQFENKVTTTYTEFPILRKDGTEVWLGQNVETSPLESSKGMVFNATGRDITERKKLQKALLRSEEKYRSVIENMKLGLMEVDPEGNIIKAYPQFCRLSGYTADELKGKKGMDFLLDNDGKELYKKQLADRKNGDPNVYEIQLVRKDGSKKWVLVSGAPFYDEYNRFKGSFGMHLDITEQKMLEKELKVARFNAEEALKSKELFLANISHEIRTPLNAIVGISELMGEKNLDDKTLAQVNHLKHSGKGLLALINELLLVSKMDAKKERLELRPMNLNKSLSQSFYLFENQAKKKEFDYVLELNLDPELIYEFDANKMEQVVYNLLSNAIKFTSYGEVKLTANVFSSSPESDVIQIIVKDTGIGIPEDDLEVIFENFEQAKNNERGEFGGTGLGLPIVKKILNLMDGKINVSSSNNTTTFEVYIRMMKASTPKERTKQLDNEMARQSLNGIKILVAEDNKVNQFLIESQLQTLGASFTIVSDGSEAIEYLKSTPVDFVLMDMRMPNIDGVTATQVLRNEVGLEELPIIGITANADEFNRQKCIDSGMNGILTKPYTLGELARIIEKYATKGSTSNGVSPALTEPTLNKELNQIFVEDSKAKIKTLTKCIETKKEQEIKEICHSLRPSLIYLNENKLAELTRKIEYEECEVLDEAKQFVRELRNLLSKLEEPELSSSMT
jgi:PAS domain S-box-containing protein